MVDLETMSTDSDAAIIAIGAVKFSTAAGITDTFYEVVDLKSSVAAGGAVSPDTILFWLRQEDAARAEFNKKGASLTNALHNFGFWMGKNAEVWGNGANFDNVILANAYKSIKVKTPWSFWQDRCYRTLASMYPEIPKKQEGVLHVAVDDARSQAQHLIEIFKHIGEF